MAMKRRHRSPGSTKAARKRRAASLESSGPRAAFLPDPNGGPARTDEDLAEELAEEFVTQATSGTEHEETIQDEITPDEIGGPFVPSTAKEEFAAGTDASNPSDAEPAPLPRTLSES
jgi:hypothetical protein